MERINQEMLRVISQLERAFQLYAEGQIQHTFDILQNVLAQFNPADEPENFPASLWREVEEAVFNLYKLGSKCFANGKLQLARIAIKLALALTKRLPQLLPEYRASLLELNAYLSLEEGQIDKAISLFRQAAEIYRQRELWEACANTLESIANCYLDLGDYALYLKLSDDAIQVAQEKQLHSVAVNLTISKYRLLMAANSSPKLIQEIRRKMEELRRVEMDAELEIEIANLRAECAFIEGDLDTAEEEYSSILEKFGKNPPIKAQALEGLADVYARRGQFSRAITLSEEALHIYKSLDFHRGVVTVLEKLAGVRVATSDPEQEVRAEQDIEYLRQQGLTDSLVRALLNRAYAYYQTRQIDKSLADIASAEHHANDISLRQIVAMAKAVILRDLGHLEDALAVISDSCTLLREQISASSMSLDDLHSLLTRLSGLHSAGAVLAGRLGRPNEALFWAEGGRAQRLKYYFADGKAAWLNKFDTSLSFAETRALLAKLHAALIMFCVTDKETLIIIVDPAEREPILHWTSLTEHDLKRLFPLHRKGIRFFFETAQEEMDNSLNMLSERLVLPLEKVIQRYKLLCLVPESYLYFVPFAALRLNNRYLIEHCALAYAPSIAALELCCSRTAGTPPRTCLAIGVGESMGFSLVSEARMIAEGYAWDSSRMIPEATIEEFFEHAPNYEVLHLSCHGTFNPRARDALSSSLLQFSNGNLTAREVAEHMSELRVQLVFLSACLSGYFRLQIDTEISGFWEVFLRLGASTVVATLDEVDPGAALRIAQTFYTAWLTEGMTKAKALRHAQLAAIQQQVEPIHWACHILVGDPR